jgi:hypothetical protein
MPKVKEADLLGLISMFGFATEHWLGGLFVFACAVLMSHVDKKKETCE